MTTWKIQLVNDLVQKCRKGEFDANALYDKLVAIGVSEEVAEEIYNDERSDR